MVSRFLEWFDNLPEPPTPPVSLVLTTSAAYLVLVLGGREAMKRRAPFKPRGLLALHNALLGVFSFASFAACGAVLARNGLGLRRTLCDEDRRLFVGGAKWLVFAFLCSKAYELLDTAFLVLQKSRLRFLHVYHHAITLVLSWRFYADEYSVGFVCAWLNMLVHSPMYLYYFHAARGGSFWWKRYLTSLQIAQFVSCMALMAVDVVGRVAWNACPRGRPLSVQSLAWAVFCYISFFVLFVQLYRENYLQQQKQKKQQQQQEEKKEN